MRTDSYLGGNLVFVVGHARSGTTFLGRLLGSHPQLGYWEEAHLLLHGLNTRNKLRELIEHADVDGRVDTVRATRSGSLFKQFRDRVAKSKVDADARASHIARNVLSDLVDTFAQISGKPNVVEKTPRQLKKMRAGLAFLPDARFIHIIRDPRDVASSMLEWKQQRGWPGWLEQGDDPVEALAKQWSRMVGAGLQVQREHPERVHSLRYEDLVTRPEATVMGMLTFLGLEWAPSVDEYLRSGNVTGVDASSQGRWRRDLTPEQIRTVSVPLLDELGYSR